MQNLNITELRAKLNELKGGGANRNFDFLEKFYNPPDWNDTLPSRSTIRVLPGPTNESGENEIWFSETALHKINGKNYHCPKKINKPCPICEYYGALWSTEKPENIEIAREIKPKKRFYMNVIARERVVPNKETGENDVRKNDGPLIYSCGVKVFEKILKFMVDEEYGDITELLNGYDFQVRKERQGEWPNYDDSKSMKNSSVAGNEEEIVEWMNNLHDLGALIRYESYDSLRQQLDIYRGIINDPFTSAQNDSPAKSAVSSESAFEETTPEKPVEEDSFFAELEKLRQNSE